MNNYSKNSLSSLLESIYERYHKPCYIHPDPLEFLSAYNDPGDREIAGIIAASLAVGRVNLILDAVKKVLDRLPSPFENLLSMNDRDMAELFSDFRYRFYNSESLTDFLSGLRDAVKQYGSLNELFIYSLEKSDNEMIPALSLFSSVINSGSSAAYRLIPDPEKGSACKRLNLYLRWMVRKDSVDPGGWKGISPASLIVPLDTHMMQIGTILGFLSRKNGDMKSALEITDCLRKFDPVDPVRFDFSLTRLGIHPSLNYDELYKQFV